MLERVRSWLSKVLVATAVAYPLSLLVAWLLLRHVGEGWWVTGIALYLPAIGFGLPLVVLVPVLLFTRRYRLLLLQLVSLLLVLVPLMGLKVSWPFGRGPAGKTLRVASYNLNSLHGGARSIAAEVLRHAPDLLFAQELPDGKVPDIQAELGSAYPHVRATGEFFVASRFPIVSELVPERLPFFGQLRSPRFMRVVVDTPLGRVVFFHVHTVSPRGGFQEVRGDGLRREILSGRLFRGERAGSIQAHSALRALQIETMARMALREEGPVMILGDTNLPPLSPIRRRHLSAFRDGFQEVGQGFGATFPAKLPWMRIDVILASRRLRFLDFDVGEGTASDHRCIVAELTLSEP